MTQRLRFATICDMRKSSTRIGKVKAHGIRWLRDNMQNKRIVVDPVRCPVALSEYFREDYRYQSDFGESLEYALCGIRPDDPGVDAMRCAHIALGIKTVDN